MAGARMGKGEGESDAQGEPLQVASKILLLHSLHGRLFEV